MPVTGSPLGSTPFGCGLPVDGAAPPTGLGQCSRFINGDTKDYEQDPDTLQLKAMPAVRQRVQLALATVRGSSTVLREFGLRRPSKFDASWQRRMRAEIASSLYSLTDVERLARLDDVICTQELQHRGSIDVLYTDLTTGRPDQVSI